MVRMVMVVGHPSSITLMTWLGRVQWSPNCTIPAHGPKLLQARPSCVVGFLLRQVVGVPRCISQPSSQHMFEEMRRIHACRSDIGIMHIPDRALALLWQLSPRFLYGSFLAGSTVFHWTRTLCSSPLPRFKSSQTFLSPSIHQHSSHPHPDPDPSLHQPTFFRPLLALQTVDARLSISAHYYHRRVA